MSKKVWEYVIGTETRETSHTGIIYILVDRLGFGYGRETGRIYVGGRL